MNIEDLISQYIDGDLSSEAESEMHHRLAVSPEARKLFRAQIALRGVARSPKVLHAPPPALRTKLFERLEREEGMKPATAPVASPAYGMEMARPVPSPAAGGDARRRRRAIAWLLPTVVASIITVAILWKPGEPVVRPVGKTLADNSTGSGALMTKPEDGVMPGAAAPMSGASSTASDAAASDVAPAAAGRSIRAEIEPRREPARSREIAHPAAKPQRFIGDETPAEADNGSDDRLSTSSPVIASADLPKQSEQSMPLAEPSTETVRPSTTALGRSALQSFKTSAVEHGKGKFDEPPPQTMGGGAAKQSPARDGGRGKGNGSLAKPEKSDGAGSNMALMAAVAPPPPPPPSGGASGNTASSPSADTISLHTDGGTPVSLLASDSRADAVEQATFAQVEPRYVVALHQVSFVRPDNGAVGVDLALRGGMQFDHGRHLLFAMVGVSGYRQTISDSVTRVVANGATSFPMAAAQSSREGNYEVIGGLGYRYTIHLSRSWGVGAGGWSSVGKHYLRAGIEAPIVYMPSQWLHLQVLPTVRYSSVQGEPVSTTGSRVLPTGEEQTFQRSTAPDGDGSIDIGIGFEASLLW